MTKISMSKQEAFDKVLNHLRQQGRAAVNSKGECVYRAPNGDMCAAGCLIPDKMYKEAFEGNDAYEIDVFSEEIEDLVEILQSAHDGWLQRDGVGAWEDQMKYIAQEYNLVYTPATQEEI